jgi:hypothetical protein
MHTVNGRDAFRTIYGVASPAPEVSVGARVDAGQPLGIVNTYTNTIGSTRVTYAFTHFQVDDFSVNAGLTNHNAVSPERFLSAEARHAVSVMWERAAYGQELTEPFLTNPRDVTFPLTRTWRLTAGTHADQIDFVRASAHAVGYAYILRNTVGAIIETGAIEIDPIARPSSLDLIPANGSARRRGLYTVLDDTLQIDYGPPGGARPATLAAASRYVTAH